MEEKILAAIIAVLRVFNDRRWRSWAANYSRGYRRLRGCRFAIAAANAAVDNIDWGCFYDPEREIAIAAIYAARAAQRYCYYLAFSAAQAEEAGEDMELYLGRLRAMIENDLRWVNISLGAYSIASNAD